MKTAEGFGDDGRLSLLHPCLSMKHILSYRNPFSQKFVESSQIIKKVLKFLKNHIKIFVGLLLVWDGFDSFGCEIHSEVRRKELRLWEEREREGERRQRERENPQKIGRAHV